MEIIALIGEPSCGKTSTLAIVYQFLLLNKYTHVRGQLKKVSNLKRDFRDVLKKNGGKIGIVTEGDTAWRVKAYLKEFDKAKCKKAICAIRPGPSFVKEISMYRSYQLVSKFKTKNNLFERIEDGMCAREIYKKI